MALIFLISKNLPLSADTVIPAGIAGIQATGMWATKAIPGFWVPAIPAGTTKIDTFFVLADDSC
ncbi:MAG: hypothetical protein ACXWTL_01220 [Methylobacter sp.]